MQKFTGLSKKLMFDIGTVEIHTAKKMNIGLAKLPADADFPRINGMGHAGYGDEVIPA